MEDRVLSPEEALPRIREIIALGGKCRLKVTGNSMWPFLRNLRDAVILSPAAAEEIKPGDIIFYVRADGHPVLHRVIRRNKEGFFVSGDAQRELESVSPGQIIARCEIIERDGRTFSARRADYRLLVLLWRLLRPLRPWLTQFLAHLAQKRGQ